MTATVSDLSDLTQRLARQEAELVALRQQLQTFLSGLRHRWEKLGGRTPHGGGGDRGRDTERRPTGARNAPPD